MAGCPATVMLYDREIDVVGRACPLPLIVLAKELRTLVAGQTVHIVGNDTIFEESIVALCRERGHTILATSRDGRTVSMVVRV